MEVDIWELKPTGSQSFHGENWIYQDAVGDTPESFHPYGPIPSWTSVNTTSSYVKTKKHTDRASFIGIACASDRTYLVAELVMPKDNKASMSGGMRYAQGSTSIGGLLGEYFGSVTTCRLVGGPLGSSYSVNFVGSGSQAQEILGSSPERFIIGGDKSPEITPNRWHHVILSFDLSNNISLTGYQSNRTSMGTCIDVFAGPNICETSGDTSVDPGRIKSACRAYLALDDVNLTGKKLTDYRDDDSGPNDIITRNALTMLGDTGAEITDVQCASGGRQETLSLSVSRPMFNFTPNNVSFKKMGLPASDDYVSDIKHVELAALQLFTDKAIDTSIKDNRRAFITDKGKYAPFSDAEDLMGKKPEVLLRSRRNWKNAKNVGSINPTKNVGVAVGEIDSYTPDPSLNGKQGKAQ